MPDDRPYTDAELEAGAKALDNYRHFIASDGYPAIRVGSHEAEAQVVLGAVLPQHAARVAEQIAQAIEHDAEISALGQYADGAARRCAEIAREHATTPTEGGQDAQPVE